MDWTQVLIPLITVLGIFVANAALIIPLFLWNRAESRADWRHTDALIRAIQDEIKDFHKRLCEIEAKRSK